MSLSVSCIHAVLNIFLGKAVGEILFVIGGSGVCLPHRRNMNHFNQCNAIFPFFFRLGVVACACNPAALEVGVGGSLASGSSVCRRSMAIGRPR